MNPQFAAPEPKIIDAVNEKFDGSSNQFSRYEMCVDLMLATFRLMRELRKIYRANDGVHA